MCVWLLLGVHFGLTDWPWQRGACVHGPFSIIEYLDALVRTGRSEGLAECSEAPGVPAIPFVNVPTSMPTTPHVPCFSQESHYEVIFLCTGNSHQVGPYTRAVRLCLIPGHADLYNHVAGVAEGFPSRLTYVWWLQIKMNQMSTYFVW